MPQQILNADPDYLFTGHGGCISFDRGKAERWVGWMDRWTEIFTQILDQPHPNMGMDPHWVEFYPYKVRIQPGETVAFNINITNHEAEARECTLRFRSVDGVQLSPRTIDLQVSGNTNTTCQVEATSDAIHYPRTSHRGRCHMEWEAHLGEIAEAVAYW